MDFSQKRPRFSLEPLEMREVPAVLGQVVELPDVAAPEAEVAQTAPIALGNGGEEYLKVKLTDVLVRSVQIDAQSHVSKKLDPASDASAAPESESAAKVQFQDFHFTRTVNKHTPVLG